MINSLNTVIIKDSYAEILSSFTYIKSPLRYPGGKPKHFSEYREPFLGGGSVFLYLRQKFPHLTFWINDLNYDVYCFSGVSPLCCSGELICQEFNHFL
jgi:hypothetical protein